MNGLTNPLRFFLTANPDHKDTVMVLHKCEASSALRRIALKGIRLGIFGRSEMTTRPNITKPDSPGYVRLPDPPEPEDMNNYIQLNATGNIHHLVQHLGNPETTIIIGEAYISPMPTSSRAGLMLPDLLIAFDVNPQASSDRNGYVIEEQGKPPDFVLEIASPSTGQRDITVKRDGYAALGIPEYWRFDDSGGQYHGAPLAGDRLVNGKYVPIPIERIDAQTHRGYSAVLNLNLLWEQGKLGWHDPATGQHITRFEDERQTRIRAQLERDEALSRISELEAELRRRGNG